MSRSLGKVIYTYFWKVLKFFQVYSQWYLATFADRPPPPPFYDESRGLRIPIYRLFKDVSLNRPLFFFERLDVISRWGFRSSCFKIRRGFERLGHFEVCQKIQPQSHLSRGSSCDFFFFASVGTHVFQGF
jgi:hypothetical protein